jgi:hypothetical protein
LGLLRRHAVVAALRFFLVFIFLHTSDKVIFFGACG